MKKPAITAKKKDNKTITIMIKLPRSIFEEKKEKVTKIPKQLAD